MRTGNRLVPSLLVVLTLAALASLPRAQAQANAGASAAQVDQPRSLLITVIEGEGALNDIRTRTAREPIVQVDDENHKPVAGALVLFSLDKTGSSYASFAGAPTLSVRTDQAGRAIAKGFQITSSRGTYNISVHATYGEVSSDAVIHQSNVANVPPESSAATRATIGALSHKKVWWIVGGVVAGGAAAGIIIATQQSSPATVTPGTGTVGAPAAVGGIRFSLRAPHQQR
jgi:hypothetical protein